MDFAVEHNVLIRRLFDGNIQDLDLFQGEISDEDNDPKDSIFNRDDEDFAGIGSARGQGSIGN